MSGSRSGQRAAGQHADADDADAGSFAISNDSELVGALVVTIVWNQNLRECAIAYLTIYESVSNERALVMASTL